MPAYGTPGYAFPAGEDEIPRKLRDLQAQIDRLGAARSAEATAIGQGGIRSSDFDGTGVDAPGSTGWMIGRQPSGESYLIMNGRLIVAGATSIAGLLAIVGVLNVTGPTTLAGDTVVTGALDVTGPMTVGGNLGVGGTAMVTGDIKSANYVAGTTGWRLTSTGLEVNTATFKPQVVPDAALASLVKGLSDNASASTSKDAGSSDSASFTFTVPAGVSTVSVDAGSAIYILTDDATPLIGTKIAGTLGPLMEVAMIPTVNSGNGSSRFARTFSVTPGSTFTVVTSVTTSTVAAYHVTTSATAIFYR